MRLAFAETIHQLAQQDELVILLTGDLGFGVFDQFKKDFPRRFINVGIAEQAMVDIAAGLAMEGYKPIVYSIASFMVGRAWEQIKVALVYHKLPVVVVGAGGGYTYSTAGTTHHAAEDLGLMSILPGMVVTCPGCPREVRELLPQLVNSDGPSYMRIGKYGEEDYSDHRGFSAEVGKASYLRSGTGGTIVTTGDLASKALKVIGPAVYQFHTIKPLDTATISHMQEPLIVVEECSPSGGLYAAILATGLKRTVIRVGPPDELLCGTIKRDVLHKQLRMDVVGIQEAIWEAVTW